MHYFKRLAIVVFSSLSQIVTSTTVTTFTSSSARSLTVSHSVSCAGIASFCPFAQTECVSDWCNNSCLDQGSCCQQANPQSCLVAANLQDPCFNIENSIFLCTATADADCLCYDGAGNYNPSSFDNMAQSCSQLAVTASPSLLSLLTGSNGSLGYCTRLAGPNNSSAVTSSSSTATPTSTFAQTGGKTSVSPTPTATTASKSGASSLLQTPPKLEVLIWILMVVVSGSA